MLDAYQTPEPEHEEDWWRVSSLAYLQLYLARMSVPLLPKKWERYLPSYKNKIKSSIFDIANQISIAQARPERLDKFISTFVGEQGSALYFIHLEMPHIPWRFYAEGQLYSLPHARYPFSPDNSDGGEWLARLSEHRYLMQAQYTDTLLGSIIARLKSLEIWDEMLVVVTADSAGGAKRSAAPGQWSSRMCKTDFCELSTSTSSAPAL